MTAIGADPRHRSIDPRYERVAGLFAVTGVAKLRLSVSPDTSISEIVTVAFKGWSPSLHQVSIRLNAEVPTDDVEGAITQFRKFADIQASRWRHAYGMSRRTEPLCADPLRKVEHLKVDSAIAAIASDMGLHLRPTLRDRLGDMHQFTTHTGTAEHRNDTSCVLETGEDRIALTRIMLVDREGPHFDGRDLRIPAEPLPETVLGSLPGRPVSDVCAVHSLLDGRTIVSARNVPGDPGFTGGGSRGPMIQLRVEPDAVPMPEK